MVNLNDQYRCGGSDSYVEWVERLLGLRIGGPTPWPGDPRFSVQVAETPSALESALAARLAEHNGARMGAGYCWPWSDPRVDGSLVPDVSIGDWSRPWNLRGDRSVGGAPRPRCGPAIPPGSVRLAASIPRRASSTTERSHHRPGPGLARSWLGRRTFGQQGPEFRNRTRVDDHEFARLVRNVDKILLIRGLSGTIIYSTDEQTRAKLRELLG